jgi:ABC-2 type transport system ATP-binding protein
MDYVRLEGVTKAYDRKYGAPTLREHVDGADASQVDLAVKDVTLSVGSGECVGVLGRRRSGRSTLLGLVAGLYRPDTGTVKVRGRATGLVSMGAGFSVTVPLRENIQLNAALLGLTPDRLAACLDEVLEFASLDRTALAYPFREISGQQRRQVGYWLAVASSPDVFVADGVVVLGKGERLERCYEALVAMREDGHAMLLGTNNKTALRRLCTRGIVLDGGEVVCDGSLKEAFRALRHLRRGDGRPRHDPPDPS